MAFHFEDEGPHTRGVAFLLWLSCVFGFCGIHRFYLGRPFTGAIWLFTFGLLGVGQVIDLFRIPALVAEENARVAALRGRSPRLALAPAGAVAAPEPEDLDVKLTRAAAETGGNLSLTQAVLATGRPYKEVEEALDGMVHAGYVGIDNDEKTGAVIYTFGELKS